MYSGRPRHTCVLLWGWLHRICICVLMTDRFPIGTGRVARAGALLRAHALPGHREVPASGRLPQIRAGTRGQHERIHLARTHQFPFRYLPTTLVSRYNHIFLYFCPRLLALLVLSILQLHLLSLLCIHVHVRSTCILHVLCSKVTYLLNDPRT